MLYVTRSASIAPEEISAVMQEAFTAIGAFIGRSGITPAAPPTGTSVTGRQYPV
jgi:hypothetical protein